ncbi:PQQ-binding-like beta-propeller repeat protein [Rhodobacter sp. CZR27]|uniref:outer membrane protein assembly factor BamB family protein n=1 Tax=Rhodobacter sp. CZR27 TaxID=2033869 RepID=UPI000BBF2262|nr:PQQ-binding-like beta-propeller repeat protein [Rhodobacter sp. CZR27]
MDIGRPRRAGFRMVVALAVVILLFGVAIAAGGAWLVALGGSWYYLVAGLGLLLTGGLLLRTSIAAVWVYLVVHAGTVAWAFWEAGWNLWAQVPRLVAPTLVLILVLLAVPVLRRAGQRLRTAPTVAATLAILGAGLLLNAANGNAHDAVPTDQPDAPAARAETPPVGDEGGTPAPDRAPAQAPGGAGTGEELPAAPAAREARAPAPVLQTGADWPAYGGTTEARRYSPLDQIDRSNVGDLERVWTFNTGDLPSEAAEGRYSPENTLLKVGDDLYICTPMGRIIAVDAATGLEEWRFDPGVSDDAIPYGATCRGVAYYEVPDAAPDEACARAAATDNLLSAVDLQTGKTLWQDVLPGGGQTTPITYEVGGRQFVVIYSGGHHFMETPISDEVVAYALPEGGP